MVEDRRGHQRARLIGCAERAIAEGGLAALRARDLASCVGCSLGAIYNLVADLDELVLRVGQRTMSDLDAHLDAAAISDGDLEAQLIAWALAYRAFAATNPHRWRALFEFRLPADADLPDWFEAAQSQLFVRLERRLAPALPVAEDVKRRARTLFSAVHGIVLIGLEQKLVALPDTALDDELAAFVRTYLAGLAVTHVDPGTFRTSP